MHYIPSFLVITLPPSQEIYSFILEVEGYPGQVTAIAVASGLIWLRFKRPDLKRPFLSLDPGGGFPNNHEPCSARSALLPAQEQARDGTILRHVRYRRNQHVSASGSLRQRITAN